VRTQPTTSTSGNSDTADKSIAAASCDQIVRWPARWAFDAVAPT
jgi:hypothetical protein